MLVPVAGACEDGAKANLRNACATPIWIRAASPHENLIDATPEEVLPGGSTTLFVQGNDFWFTASRDRNVTGAASRFNDGEHVVVAGDRCP